MNNWFRLGIFSTALVAIAGCAPQLMPLDRFPIPLGQSFTLELATEPVTKETFILSGEPLQEEDKLGYYGKATNGDAAGIQVKVDSSLALGVIISMDGTPYLRSKKVLYCQFDEEGGYSEGIGKIGDSYTSALVGTFLGESPKCKLYRTP